MNRPLEGLIVVALEQAVAAPFCTARLADAGARVIKIERPEGDFARFYDDIAGGQSSYFVWLNRGKQSVVLDLTNPASCMQMEALLAGADIFVQNLKLGAVDRLGFSRERLRAAYPRLIYCSISGYGDSGPLAGRKAYDLLIQAESGLASITGSADAPARVGISMVDIATGATAHAAILEALVARAQSGSGADIRVSMFDVMADWLTVPLIHAEALGNPKRVGLAHPTIAPYGAFPTSDGGEILIAIQNEREWQRFCADVLVQPELVTDPAFAVNLARVRNRSATDALVARAFARLPKAALVEMLEKADIGFASVNDMQTMAAHSHLRRVEVETANASVHYPPPGPIVDGASPRLGKVPALGEHTKAVLSEFASPAG